jgi:hypothetical protein
MNILKRMKSSKKLFVHLIQNVQKRYQDVGKIIASLIALQLLIAMDYFATLEGKIV